MSSNKKKHTKKSPPRPKKSASISQQHPSVIKFIISYIFLMSFFLILIGLEDIKNILDINMFYTQMIVNLSLFLLQPFEIIKETNGSIIKLADISLDVRFGCNGLEAFFIYIAGIISFPSSLMMKLSGIIIGFILLQLINVIRIAGLALSAVYLEQYFDIIHTYIAQGIMIAVALGIFFIWLHYAHKIQNT